MSSSLGMRAWQPRGSEVSHVPVIVLHHLSETQKRALALANNRLGLDAGGDEALLRQELAAWQEQNFKLELTGFPNDELQQLAKLGGVAMLRPIGVSDLRGGAE